LLVSEFLVANDFVVKKSNESRGDDPIEQKYLYTEALDTDKLNTDTFAYGSQSDEIMHSMVMIGGYARTRKQARFRFCCRTGGKKSTCASLKWTPNTWLRLAV